MKSSSRKLILGIYAFLLAILSLGSCNSDDYLVDGGTSNPYFDGNVMQYLESRPDLFKDLVEVIKLTKWEDILTNEKVTFFVPADFTIVKSVEQINYRLYNYQGMGKITELSQVKPAMWEDPIGMYVMEGKHRLNDIAQIDTAAVSTFPGQTNFTHDRSYKMTMGVCYGDASGIKYAGYRQVMYAYQDFGYPEYAYVSPCSIEPTNGIVHVLRLDHHLGFPIFGPSWRALEARADYSKRRGGNSGLIKTTVREEEPEDIYIKEKNDE